MIELTDEEFNNYLKYLNHMNNDYFPWQNTKANKEHIDEYGITINKGEVYYKRQHDSVNNVLKLSKKSMEKILYLIMKGNNIFQSYGKYKEEELKKEMRKIAAAR